MAGVPGTLWLGRNVVISRGGDIERMKKFVPKYELPAGTFGMTEILGQLYVFGSADLAGVASRTMNASRKCVFTVWPLLGRRVSLLDGDMNARIVLRLP